MRRSLYCLAAAAFAAAVTSAVLAAQAPATRTVWDGAYTDAQAARGSLAFNQSCANCHATGEDGTRPITNKKF